MVSNGASTCMKKVPKVGGLKAQKLSYILNDLLVSFSNRRSRQSMS